MSSTERAMIEGSSSKGYVRVPSWTPYGGKPTTAHKTAHPRSAINASAHQGIKVVETDMMGCKSSRSFDGDLLDKSITPQLAQGDLLLVRGDIIHRTGKRENTPFRLVLSMRAVQTPTPESAAQMCLRRRASLAAIQVASSRFNPTLCHPTKRLRSVRS
mmetsp:Transcript_23984/g.61830  ORF Transcript_23984/g.61830 Transcript_23984/m.61830 type:complete len:159 (-) Transcript_23984:276-752(-)